MSVINIESNAGDGDCYVAAISSFAQARAQEASTVEASLYAQVYRETSTSWYIRRGYIPFDLSSLPVNADITAVTVDVYPTAKEDTANEAHGDIILTQTGIGSPPNLDSADFDELLNATKLHDDSEDKDITNITLNSDLTWTLNSSGIAYVQAAYDAGNYCEIAMITGYDFADTAPTTGNNYITCQVQGQANPPTINITYTVHGGGLLAMM